MESIIVVSMAITVGVTTLLEVVKHTFTSLNVKYYPLIALVLGIIIAVGTDYIPELNHELSLPALIVAGAIAGLSASGFYDLTVKPMKKENQ